MAPVTPGQLVSPVVPEVQQFVQPVPPAVTPSSFFNPAPPFTTHRVIPDPRPAVVTPVPQVLRQETVQIGEVVQEVHQQLTGQVRFPTRPSPTAAFGVTPALPLSPVPVPLTPAPAQPVPNASPFQFLQQPGTNIIKTFFPLTDKEPSRVYFLFIFILYEQSKPVFTAN